ncbi:MAG: preprotein translocase subunit SecA [Candidatus Omnitrophota bacterium]
MMLGKLLKIIGTQNDRELKRLWPTVQRISALEEKISSLTDAELCAKTDIFKVHLREKEKEIAPDIETLREAIRESTSPEMKIKVKEKLKWKRNTIFEAILPEAFAVVREAGKRTIGMRHFDVQLMGGIVLHEGRIAEMATGEGKTLVATLPVYLNALLGRGVHVVTVNDYLARRDREWMGPIYEFLGLSVGAIQHDMPSKERQAAYGSDVTYGTNNEYGFDYLRDNMVLDKADRVQRELHYAIVDEVDSILIDEARTPLIISGPAEESTEKYYQIDRIIPRLKLETDYQVDEKHQTANLTEEGVHKVEGLLEVENLYEDVHIELVHHVNQALRAHTLFRRDVDYVVKDDEVLIVDEFTGRLMPGRRWSDGLHQAIEAKEGAKIERENQTLATITFQNYFRMFEKLAGMTGTAATEAVEFDHIYKLDVVVIPTNRPLIRTNHPDVIYRTEKEKFNAVVGEIADLYRKGRPVLVGTISIDKSEVLSAMLKKRGILHQVLNAKYHEMEARIVAQAGRKEAVTIATNMAGRGTDILLGGNVQFLAQDLIRRKGKDEERELAPEERGAILSHQKKEVDAEHEAVVALGGLHILGTERHEARRIDNQLRGRSGRQGDPGSSRFYLSLEDDLMRIFASDRIARLMNFFKWEENVPIEHRMISRSIEIAQKRVEGYHFDIRKQLLNFDNVMNRQREVIYDERRSLIEGEKLKDHIFEMAEDVVSEESEHFLNVAQRPEEWDLAGLCEWVRSHWGFVFSVKELEEKNRDEVREGLIAMFKAVYEAKEKELGEERMRYHERMILLHVVDSKWKDHLYMMDGLREGIGLRAYGQRDPLIEYQHEAFAFFQEMIRRIKEDALEYILRFRMAGAERLISVFESLPQEFVHPEAARFEKKAPQRAESFPLESPFAQAQAASPESPEPYRREAPKVGRNDPCPCGSGKKYKKCHGA